MMTEKPGTPEKKTIVGVLELASKYRYGITSRGAPMYLFRPYDEEEPDYIVGSTERDTSRNQIAIVSVDLILGKPEKPEQKEKQRASLQRLLGPVGDYNAEITALLEYYCPSQQKQKKGETKETKSQGGKTEEPDTGRVFIDADHGWITFHIDPIGCRDIDDAIAYHPETKTWSITIADAAAAVPIGSDIDKAARAIGSTFYSLDGRAIRPMLPAEISEGSASLLPGEPRRGITLFCPPAKPYYFAPTWITVKHSFSYESFPASVIAFDLQISRDPHLWIEELMIRYNTAAATIFKSAGRGLLRTQKASDDATGWAAIDPDLAPLANEAATYELADSTEAKEQGHASLGLAAYCHASSPLRRYADLVNQRILKALVRGSTSDASIDEAQADHLNQRTKANRRWTRDLTFLNLVKPGKVHTVTATWISATNVWIPEWRRIIKLRHEEVHPAGYKGAIHIFCDPTKRNWKRRILTASV